MVLGEETQTNPIDVKDGALQILPKLSSSG